ncbi:MAG: DUF2905 domain-containing protein [Gammaproteobacteria bacterium]|nr:DUF2905 domain-containing protein [Gammaproteobacteria bacterium]
MQKLLILIGVAILIAGLAWPWLSRLPLGRLPGDLMIERPGFRLYLPITSMIVVSALATVLLWLFRR